MIEQHPPTNQNRLWTPPRLLSLSAMATAAAGSIANVNEGAYFFCTEPFECGLGSGFGAPS
jgi:hypothetical protein